VLATSQRSCTFCDSTEVFPLGDASATTTGNLALNSETEREWQGELNQRLQAYRARRRKLSAHESQTKLPFDDRRSGDSDSIAVQVDDSRAGTTSRGDDFAFTIAIGRPPRKQEPDDARFLIDVSLPPRTEESPSPEPPEPAASVRPAFFPVASLAERRLATLIDIGCLAFAYGGFLTLFGSLGGHFTLSKLSAAVCFFTFAFVYLQYFGLFTIFGGTTPGMMVRGLQVVSFSGETPTPRQFLLRAVGYLLSAGTLFLGFLWALWDEDSLSWHDRLSRTYLTVPETLVDTGIPHSPATLH
jgi:uncharacterized RDD family membrane protein YckC